MKEQRVYQITQKKHRQLKKKALELEIRRQQLNKDWEKAVIEGDDRETDAITVSLKLLHENELERRELNHILRNVTILDRKITPTIEIGSTAIVKIDNKKKKIMIVDPIEADPLQNKYSYESPIGKALLGLNEGDEATYSSPNGVKTRLQVVSVDGGR